MSMESHDAKMLRKQLRRMGAVAVNKGSGEVFGRQTPALLTAQPVNPVALLTPTAQARPLTRVDRLKSRTRVRQKKGSATQVLIHESASPTQRAELTKANLAFANATDRSAKIRAAKSVLKELARLAGIKAHTFEAPALSYILATADDCLEGRNPHLWRAVSGVKPPRNHALSGPQKVAASCILQCTTMAQKMFAAPKGGPVSFRKALLKVFADIEDRLNGAQIDDYFADGKEDDDSKSSDTNARTARLDNLVKRFERYRRGLADEWSCSVSDDYRDAIKRIDDMPAGELLNHAEYYDIALLATKNHLINARVDPDDRIDPKGGKSD